MRAAAALLLALALSPAWAQPPAPTQPKPAPPKAQKPKSPPPAHAKPSPAQIRKFNELQKKQDLKP